MKRIIKDYLAKLKTNTFKNLKEWTIVEKKNAIYLNWLQKKEKI